VDPESWRAAGRHLTIAGRRLFLMDSDPDGERQRTILLIHGFPTAGWDFSAIFSGLEREFRLVIPDMLGFGFSEKPKRHDYSIHEQADLLEGMIDALSLERFHVLAHDYGDTVAQELLARENERAPAARHWLSLCLLNGGLFPETHHARLSQKLLHGPLGGIVARLMNRGTLERNLRAVFGPDTPPSPEDMEAFWTLVTHEGGNTITHRLIRYIHDRRVHRERWVRALREASIPIQLINGSLDPVSGAHMVERYREVVGTTDIVELPRIGHYPQVEAPEEVVRHYRAFLEAHFPAGDNA
jgi:pimeloyl-ACP methyl ester carboxylesterase